MEPSRYMLEKNRSVWKKILLDRFYELAGFRQDNNLLPNRYEEGRISGADIDPSLPEITDEYNLVTERFFRRSFMNHLWLLDPFPRQGDRSNTYLKGSICGEKGIW